MKGPAMPRATIEQERTPVHEIDAALDRVSKVYPGEKIPAVDAIDLDVRKGEFFSLLGPSGCGKTTTLKMIAGLEKPTGGRILIRSRDVSRTPAHQRPTNLVFQRLALFPHLTVAGNIAFGPKLKRRPSRQIAQTVDRLLDMVELGGFADRYPSQLSGGQQQRVAIARALANEPAVLLLDEPLGALDLRLRVQMQQSLKRIQQDSATTFIYVTHDQTEALAMSDRVAVMNAGRVEQIAAPDDLYLRPATRFVAKFLGDTNLLEGRVEGSQLDTGHIRIAVPAGGSAASIRPERVALAARLPDGTPNRLPGVITGATFHGATIQYRVQVADDTEIVVERPSTSSDVGDLRPGSTVEVGLDPEAIVMVG
jgi:ABC-type Fe3+/spermidine/putrescine transport system ATPase subunit